MNTDINERLKIIRKLSNKTQKEFSDILGISQGGLSDIERGRIPVSDKNIKLICMQLNVNEEWLRFGNGETFNNQYEHRDDLSLLEKEILSKFNLLEETDRNSIKNIIDALYQKNLKE